MGEHHGVSGTEKKKTPHTAIRKTLKLIHKYKTTLLNEEKEINLLFKKLPILKVENTAEVHLHTRRSALKRLAALVFYDKH